MDHILVLDVCKVSQYDVIDVGLSDHQLVYCTRKTNKAIFSEHKKISFRSFKNYDEEIFCSELENANFTDFSQFNDINMAYNNFHTTLLNAIDKVAPFKEARIKNRTQEWFDGEIAESITERDRLFKKFKQNSLQINFDIFKEAKYKTKMLINRKKGSFSRVNLPVI